MKRSRRKHAKEDEKDNETVKNEEGCDDYCSIMRLPEACLAQIISLTTPRDACRSSAVSTGFQTVASSNEVWERFLPSGYRSILARADYPVDLTSTKKEIFLSLAQDHVILDEGTKSFWLERTSGAKCYMLSSRSLQILWGDYPLYWRRIYSTDSRFEEVAELVAVCWLHIIGRIDSGEFSPNTMYAAYLVFNLADESYGLDGPTAVITMDGESASAKRVVYFHPQTTEGTQSEAGKTGDKLGGGDERGRVETSITVSYPTERDDGWMEVELGEFYNRQTNTGMVSIELLEHVQLQWKKGLVLEGIEIRQKS